MENNVQTNTAALPEKKKKALVIYLAGLFTAAFVIVLISLIFNGGGNATAENLETLQLQVQQLQAENDALRNAANDGSMAAQIAEYQEQIRQLQETVTAMSENAEYWESNAQDADNLKNKQLEAANLLIMAQQAYISGDRETLESYIEYLQLGAFDFLDEDGLYAYYMILEYMEQPYFGN